MRLWLPFVATLLLALTALGCERTADLIPGDDDGAGATATASASNGTPQPVVPPASLQVSGADSESSSAPEVADAVLARSVVQILVSDDTRVPPVVRDGSGVVIDAERGLILTSANIVDPFDDNGSPSYTTITIATSAVPGGEPHPTHRAVLAALDPGSELAVLRVVGLVAEGDDGTSSSSAAAADASADAADEQGSETGGPLLALPAATVGDPSLIKRGDPLRLFGHPGLDPSGAVTAQSLMVASAEMTGALGDPTLGDRAWIRTDAFLPHGSAGGPVYNRAGELVGIAAQLSYDPDAPVAYARPLNLADQIIAEAQTADENQPYQAPLLHRSAVPGTSLTANDDGVTISEPLFALEAIDEGGERDLFDYALVFPSQTTELYYEYVAQGIPNGATVQEFWYLDGVFQDELSSTYNWTLGPFAIVSDRLVSPNPAGVPDGVWTLEIWVDGVLHTSGQAFLGVSPPQPTFGDLEFASTFSSLNEAPGQLPSSGSSRLFAFFDYQGAATVEWLHWVVSHDDEVFYRSPEVPWRGGDSGTWWVGMPAPDGLDEGNWQVEIWADDAELASGSFDITPEEPESNVP